MALPPFATNWWGKAWIDALEQRGSLDPNRLPRGRTYARKGRVQSVRITPGEIRALVQGNRPVPYEVRIEVRQFTDDEWNDLLDAIASRAGHAAALLDGELDPAVVEDAARAGVSLLPGPGDLKPRCTCPDWANPCKHSAAVCYLVAREFDRDPFALLLLRGRRRDQVLDEIRRRRTADRAGTPAPSRLRAVDPGLTAREAWQRPLGALPVPPPPRDRRGRPAPLAADPPAHIGFTTASLAALVDDAAARAWAAARGMADSGLAVEARADLARRAHEALELERPDAERAQPGRGSFDRLVSRSKVRARDLMADAEAWANAGAGGVQALHEVPWPAPLARMAAGRDAVIASGANPGQVRIRNNTITVAGRTQLRLSMDGRWYRLDKRGGRWEMAAAAADEPDDLVFTRRGEDDDE